MYNRGEVVFVSPLSQSINQNAWTAINQWLALNSTTRSQLTGESRCLNVVLLFVLLRLRLLCFLAISLTDFVRSWNLRAAPSFWQFTMQICLDMPDGYQPIWRAYKLNGTLVLGWVEGVFWFSSLPLLLARLCAPKESCVVELFFQQPQGMRSWTAPWQASPQSFEIGWWKEHVWGRNRNHSKDHSLVQCFAIFHNTLKTSEIDGLADELARSRRSK